MYRRLVAFALLVVTVAVTALVIIGCSDDDPVTAIPAGYNLVDLNEEPFEFSKEARPIISLFEGEIAVNDFSAESYRDAFAALIDKVSREYPFTEDNLKKYFPADF